MNMNKPSPDDPGPNPDKSPFEFFAVYVPGEGTQRHYLSNGQKGKLKGIRLFKSEQAAHDYLQLQLDLGRLPQEVHDRIVIQPVEGKLALPAELQPRLSPFGNAPEHLQPITTLHKPSVPTAMELLADYQRRQKRRRRH
jgi:hypothetical protein